MLRVLARSFCFNIQVYACSYIPPDPGLKTMKVIYRIAEKRYNNKNAYQLIKKYNVIQEK